MFWRRSAGSGVGEECLSQCRPFWGCSPFSGFRFLLSCTFVRGPVWASGARFFSGLVVVHDVSSTGGAWRENEGASVAGYFDRCFVYCRRETEQAVAIRRELRKEMLAR